MNINYFSEDIAFQLSDQSAISSWITTVIESEGYQLQEISYIFCTDEYLLEINKEHLNHNYYTDIITFDNSEENKVVESDIFISIDRVRENALSQKIQLDTEVYRVMIHGILHLVGYNDRTEQEKKLMREKEDACLSLLKI